MIDVLCNVYYYHLHINCYSSLILLFYVGYSVSVEVVDVPEVAVFPGLVQTVA